MPRRTFFFAPAHWFAEVPFGGHSGQRFPAVASIAIGLLLMSVAGILASRSKGLLLGEGVTPGQLADIRRIVEADPAVERAGDILTMYMGPHDLLVNMGVAFVPGTTAEQMHEAIRRIETELQKAYPETSQVYIEAESLPAMVAHPPVRP